MRVGLHAANSTRETNGSHLKLSQVKNRNTAAAVPHNKDKRVQEDAQNGGGSSWRGARSTEGLKDVAKERHYAPAYRTTISQTMNTLAK